jgi:amino acid adenylation domain-containing protein
MDEWTFPASYAQERVWLANQLDPRSPVYNVSSPARPPAGLTQEQVTGALAEVIGRHESLRTYLRVDDGVLMQVVRAAEPVRPPVVDLRAVPESERSVAFHALAEELAQAAIPLDQPPLWRAKLLRLGDTDWSLLFVAHHAVFDGHSAVIFGDELTALFHAALHGAAADLADLPIQYADFAVWQREQFAGPQADEQLAFWRDRLAGAAPVLGLPLDRPRPRDPGFAGDEVRFTLPDGLLERVAGLGRSLTATPYMVLLSAFAALLSRLAGSDDLVVGVSTAGRDRPELVPLIGMFVNPIALRCDLAGDPTVAELVGRVRDSLVDALEHGQAPFQRVVEVVAAARDSSAQPIFQTAFNFIPDSGLDEIALGTTKDDLAFDLTTATSRLLYRTALFDRTTAEGIVGRYLRLLDAAVADPAQRVSQLPVLAEAERELVLRNWSGTSTPRTGRDGGESTVTALIEAQVARTPQAIALICGGVSLTYAELNACANRLARTLIARGAGPESLVALVLPRSVELAVAMLAVLKSGAAYLPIDPDHPAERIAYLLDDAQPAAVLARDVELTGGADRAGDSDVTDAERIAPLRPGHPAYVLYTSGSTGRPKGVVVEHRLVHAYLTWAAVSYPSLSGTALLHSPVSFDLSVTGLLGPLTVGGTVRLAAIDEPAARVGGRPTFLKATPSHLSLLDGDLSPTGDLVLGGEALTGEALADWRSANPCATVWNEYGPTEATVGCVAARIAPGQRLPAGPVTIGRPVGGTEVYLLDAALQPVPPGAVGQLYLAGDQVARGYLRRPGLTAGSFRPCPFGPPGRRMYATGDLARWRADGTIDYLGRIDDQVKVRGVRVELGEIASTLRGQPGVREAAVVVRTDDRGEPDLVAYVVGDADPARLAADLARTLPAQLVPAAFVPLPALPLTRNGKLDRDALPSPAVLRPAYLAPSTDAQVLVAEVFAEILKVEKVGAGDHFFDLGGNSLRGMRAMARIRGEIGVDVPMWSLFRHPVVADLATEIERLIAAELDQLSDSEVVDQLRELSEQAKG